MPVKRVCNTFSRERALTMCPMSSQVLNRPDIHQEMVSRYAKYSQKYWAGVRVRQRAYLDEQQSQAMSVFEPRPSSVYRRGISNNYILQCSTASQVAASQVAPHTVAPHTVASHTVASHTVAKHKKDPVKSQAKGCYGSMICR